ncbi:MAG: response regulator [Phycisphaeraceae bacterium]|nr:response regulator [Phycisphaeraceae bacterium]
MSITINKTINTLNVGDRERQKLVDYVNAAGLAQAASIIVDEDRRNLRVDFQTKGIQIEVISSEGQSVRFDAMARNLSNRGFAFFHGQFVHMDARCKLYLPQSNDDQVYCIEGRITRSRHIRGLIHEVVMVFDHPIDLTRFVKLGSSQFKKNMLDRGDDRAGHVIVAVMGEQKRALKSAVTPKVLDEQNITFHHGLRFSPGVVCVIGLPCKDGTQINAIGRISSCEKLDKEIYVINVKYDKPVDCSNVITWMDDWVDVIPDARKALVIDDDLDSNRLLIARLKQMDINATAVTTGSEGYKIISEQDIDVIMLDIHLGEEMGYDVSVKLRELGYEGPIVAISADDCLSTEGHSLASGCNTFLSKPIKPEALKAILARLWNSQQELPVLEDVMVG